MARAKPKRRISEAEQYFQDVLDGKIVACAKIQALAAIMLPRFENGYKKWHFDYDAGNRPVKFIETECYVPSGRIGKHIELEPFQKAYIQTAFGFVDDDGNRQFKNILIVIGRKNGKALALDTPIPTPKGWKTMADIHVGDYVFGKDGQPVEVLLESEVFDKPMYRVSFEDGSYIDASVDHIWTVQTKHSRRCLRYDQSDKKYTKPRKVFEKLHDGPWFEITTGEMVDDFMRVRADGKGVEYKYRVPMNGEAKYPYADLPVHPYTLGVWLGDGTATKTEITTNSKDLGTISDNLLNYGYNVKAVRYPSAKGDSLTLKINPYKRNDKESRSSNALRSQLKKLGVFGNKHIPDEYMTASVEQRWALLRGLMDTDGTCSKSGQCEITQKSEKLAYQIKELCASLGIKATLLPSHAFIGDKDCGIYYSVRFFTDKKRPCFTLDRQVNRLKDSLSQRMDAKSIVSIEAIPNKPSKCIMVDDPWHLYLAGESYTPTHNTTTVAALELYMLIADREGAPQIYNVATSKDQASLGYGAAVRMFKLSKRMKKLLRTGIVKERAQDGIINDSNLGYITPLSSNTSHLDGLDVHLGVVDEVAALVNRDVFDLVRQGTGSRDNPMMFLITTNGFVRNNVFDSEYDYAARWLAGEVDDDTLLPFIYELDERDEYLQEEMWPKANPGLGTIKKVDYLRDQVNKAKQDPSYLPTVLTKEFNVPQNQSCAWLRIEECVNRTKVDDWKSMGFKYGIAGFDAADTIDLNAAKVLLMRPGDPCIYEKSMYWIPEAVFDKTDETNRERDDVPYRQWIARDLMRTYPGNKVDKRVFLDWFQEVEAELGIYIYAIGFDPWHVDDSTFRELQAFVGEQNCHKIRQGAITLSQPMKQLRAEFQAGHVIDDDNPVNQFCRMNVQVRPDVNGNIQPDKKMNSPKFRIDGFVAELCAYTVLSDKWEDYQSIISG